MIPDLIRLEDAPYGVLPPGVHFATLPEIERRFAWNQHRAMLHEGIVRVADALRKAGCRTMYLDGSYVTDKEEPEDFDGCWDPEGMAFARLDPVLLDFSYGRSAQKQKYGGEMFVSNVPVYAFRDTTFLDHFQTDKETKAPKGIIAIRLGDQS